jgi:hypothetical protein
MSASQLLPVTHVLPLTIIRRERQLPVPGTISARLNERVQATDVLAEAEVAPRHLFLDLERGLGIAEREVAKVLAHQPGDWVEAGEVLAGPVGVARRTVRAPASGRLAAVVGGRALFEVRSSTFSLRAGVPGMVVGTDGSRSVTLEVSGALIQGKWGNGRQEYGVMRLVTSNPAERLISGQLDINLRGAILIAGILDHPAPFTLLTELTVRGLVLGSMSSDLIPLAQRMPFPILLTEGFGSLPMCTPAFNLLSSNAGREAAVDARPSDPNSMQRPEIIIPLPAGRTADVPDEVIPLAKGARVRVLRPPHQSAVGTVRDLPARAADLPSGLLARAAMVELDGVGVKTVPIANLEVLQ